MEIEFKKIFGKKRRALCEANYRQNGEADSSPESSSAGKLINDQNGATGRAFAYGKYPARRNACEAIAVHNARVLLGETSCLSEVIARFQMCGAMIFSGFFGSNVYKIGKVLKSCGIPYKKTRPKRATEPGIYIFSFWNEKPLKNGIHTVAALLDKNGFTVYNLNCDGNTASTPPEVFAKRHIVGYYIKERMEKNE